jgi:hypothetical protein
MEVYARSAKRRPPTTLLSEYRSNRFAKPSGSDPARLLGWDSVAFSHLPKGFQAIELSPVSSPRHHLARRPYQPGLGPLDRQKQRGRGGPDERPRPGVRGAAEGDDYRFALDKSDAGAPGRKPSGGTSSAVRQPRGEGALPAVFPLHCGSDDGRPPI